MMDQPIAQTLTRERLARLARDEAHIFGEDRSPHYAEHALADGCCRARLRLSCRSDCYTGKQCRRHVILERNSGGSGCYT
jgi:hypothetical protein